MQPGHTYANRVPLYPEKLRSLPKNECIAIHTTEYIDLISAEDIHYIRAEGSYSRITLFGGEELLSSRNLGIYEEKLGNRKFIRPHQSFLVNLRSVRRIRKSPYCSLILDGNIEVPVSRLRRKDIIQCLLNEVVVD